MATQFRQLPNVDLLLDTSEGLSATLAISGRRPLSVGQVRLLIEDLELIERSMHYHNGFHVAPAPDRA